MLQRIIATAMVVVGLVVAGLAVASATIWRESDTVAASTTASKDARLMVTDPGVLDLVAKTVKVRATAAGPVSVVVGRDVDVQGWVGKDTATRVTGLKDWETLSTKAMGAATAGPTATATPGGEATAAPAVPASDPAGSDMWIDSASGTGSATLTLTTTAHDPGRLTLLVAATGKDAGPPSLQLTWHRTVTTPLLWPGVALGAALAIAGGLWLAVILRSAKRPKAPRPEPVGAGDVDAGSAPRVGGVASKPVDIGRSSVEPQGPSNTAEPPAIVEPEAITRVMTRREIREQEESQRVADRPKRNWLTGSIPIVPRERRPKTAAQRAVDASEARADAWRRAWGMERDAKPSAVPPVVDPLTGAPTTPRDVDAAPYVPTEAPGAPSLPSRRTRRGSHAAPEDFGPGEPTGFSAVGMPEVPGAGRSGFDASPGRSPGADGSGEPPLRRRGRRLFVNDTDGTDGGK